MLCFGRGGADGKHETFPVPAMIQYRFYQCQTGEIRQHEEDTGRFPGGTNDARKQFNITDRFL